MWFAVLLLALALPAAAIAAEPSASELLERTKAGKSVVSDADSIAPPQSIRGIAARGSFGVGMYAIGEDGDMLFAEISAYLDGRNGIYFAYGWLSDDVLGDWEAFNGGWCTRLDDHARMGLGIQHHKIDISSPGFIAFEEIRTGPHGWLELGLRRGPAVRIEYSKLGLVAALHIRIE